MLLDLGLLLKNKLALLERTNRDVTGLKHEIREILKENKMTSFDDDRIKIKMTRNYTFDHGLFKMDNPELVKRYFKTETITKTKDVFSRKQLLRECPEEYKKCLIELTARLSIK